MRMARFSLPASLLAFTLLVACRDEPRQRAAAPPVASTAATETPAPAPPAMVWDSAVGPALLLATDAAPDSVGVVLPIAAEGSPEHATTDGPDHMAALTGARVDLIGRSGLMGTATLGADITSRASRGCTQWPRTHLLGSRDGWGIALLAGRATAIALDSLRGLPADSTQLAARIAQLAAASSARDTTFSGVPFVVRSMYRFRVGGAEVVAASLRRSIPSEANPREEQTFLIAEREPSDSAYRIAFTRRAAGEDEPAQITNPLAAVMLQDTHRAAIVVSHERESGGSVGLIERVAPGVWRETWRSGYVGC
jgi:hypothetical protein